MKIVLRLSSKTDNNGMNEILLSANNRINGKVVTIRAKSEVFINPTFFSKEKGVDMSHKKVIAPEVRKWHNNAKTKLDGILSAIALAEQNTTKIELVDDWMKNIVEHYLHPERFAISEELENKTVYDYAEEYIVSKRLDNDYVKRFYVLMRTISRYEGFVRATDKERKFFCFDINTLTREDVEDFRNYLRNEEMLSHKYNTLFKRLLKEYPIGMTPGRKCLEKRGENYVINQMKKLKTFVNWMIENGKTANRPFDSIKIGTQRYGTPYYITIDERNAIAETPMPTKHLETQRDIFVFQCFVGCRVSDFIKLTEANITNGILEYTPHKTKDDGELSVMARVPLHQKAIELLEKYKGADAKGRLFPFISPQKYNDAIKDVFTIAGITRNVEIRNAKTGEMEIRPINEIASSHLARRTFVGNAYRKVSDPNIIGKMSGHVEGSKAFSRYRNIEDETLRNVIDQIG